MLRACHARLRGRPLHADSLMARATPHHTTPRLGSRPAGFVTCALGCCVPPRPLPWPSPVALVERASWQHRPQHWWASCFSWQNDAGGEWSRQVGWHSTDDAAESDAPWPPADRGTHPAYPRHGYAAPPTVAVGATVEDWDVERGPVPAPPRQPQATSASQWRPGPLGDPWQEPRDRAQRNGAMPTQSTAPASASSPWRHWRAYAPAYPEEASADDAPHG